MGGDLCSATATLLRSSPGKARKWPTLIIGGIIFLPAGLEFIAPEGAIALGQSLSGLRYAAGLNGARILVGTHLAAMGVTSAAYRPINEKVLQLLEEEMVLWEVWRR